MTFRRRRVADACRGTPVPLPRQPSTPNRNRTTSSKTFHGEIKAVPSSLLFILPHPFPPLSSSSAPHRFISTAKTWFVIAGLISRTPHLLASRPTQANRSSHATVSRTASRPWALPRAANSFLPSAPSAPGLPTPCARTSPPYRHKVQLPPPAQRRTDDPKRSSNPRTP